MPLRERKYETNQTLLKVFGAGNDKKIKLIHFKCLRNADIVCDDEISIPKGSVNDQKLFENISRAKSRIFELAYCNEWEYFFTGTLDQTKYDRTNLNKYHEDFTRFLRNYRRNSGCGDIQFLLVPELHSDGKTWHIHGFLKGLPVDYLHQFDLGDRMGKYIAEKVLAGDLVYDWPAYARKFGFCDLEPIKNQEAVSKYVTKYMSKSLYDTCLNVGSHLYYRSRGLSGAQLVRQGTLIDDTGIPIDYESDFCRVSWVPYSDELLDRLSKTIL